MTTCQLDAGYARVVKNVASSVSIDERTTVVDETRAEFVRRMWRAGIAGLVIGGIIGFAVSFAVPTRYAASSDVLIQPAPGARVSDGIDDRLLRSYATVLGGRENAAAVHEVQSSLSVSEIDRAVDAEVLDDSTILRVTAERSGAQSAADLSAQAAASFVQRLIDDGVAAEPGADVDPDDPAAPKVTATVVTEATAPATPTSPRRTWWVIGGALIGLLVCLVAARTRQTTDRRIRSSQALTDLTGLPLIGAFGFDRAAARQTLATDLDPTHPRFEASRIMRTNLQFLDVDQSSSVLTITSSVPDEGKTTVATNVAVALARGGQSVVLVEGDLRRPRLAALFDLPSGVGLTTALIGRTTVEEAVHTTAVPGLDVMTGGTRPPNPSELLQTQAMDGLITTLSRHYDVVLIDAPPLLPVTDAALLARASDGALLVVRHGRTTQEQVRTAIERLDGVGATLYGTVLTMVPARGSDKYGYGYGYAPEEEPTGRRARR